MRARAQEMGSSWLREKAEELRRKASQADGAYNTDPMARMCQYVARHYRRAAVVLDDAATALEDDWEVTRHG